MPETKRRFAPVIAAIVAAVIIAIVLYFYLLEPAAVTDYVATTGVIEATEVDLSPKISGRISWLCCEEGFTLEDGDLAVRLDETELKARVENSRAALSAATEEVARQRTGLENARLASETAGFDTEAATAEITRTKALVDESRLNLDRAVGLYKDGFIPKRDLDAARADFDSKAAQQSSAVAHLKAAEAGLKSAKVNIKAASVGISVAEARRNEAAAQLKVAESALSDTRIYSPIVGVIAYKAYETGEFVNPGAPVYTLYDLHDIWARVDIEESAIQKVRLGEKVEVRALGVPDKVFAARVSEVGEVGGFATQRDVTRGRPDVKTFRVKAAITDPQGFLKPGMTVEVRIYYGAKGGG